MQLGNRAALGAADLPDDALAALVARQLGLDESEVVELVDSTAEVAPYDLEALTTAGRYRVRGRARTARDTEPYAFFVKVVQSWARSPMFAFVPPEHVAPALLLLPWEVEPAVYRSDLADRLPAGLTPPVAYAVIDLDEESRPCGSRRSTSSTSFGTPRDWCAPPGCSVGSRPASGCVHSSRSAAARPPVGCAATWRGA